VGGADTADGDEIAGGAGCAELAGKGGISGRDEVTTVAAVTAGRVTDSEDTIAAEEKDAGGSERLGRRRS
jgi:hypothetical protein